MNHLVKGSLIRRLSVLFILAALIPLGISAFLSYRAAKRIIERDAYEQLATIREHETEEVISFLAERMELAEIMAATKDVQLAFRELKDYHDRSGASAQGTLNVTSQDYQKVYGNIDEYFRTCRDRDGDEDILIVCAAHGHILYSVARHEDLGENVGTGRLRDSGLGEVWQKVVRTGKPQITDLSKYRPADDEPNMFIGAPIHDEAGDLLAVLVLRRSPGRIQEIVTRQTGLGETGKIYLVGEDRIMRSGSRFDDMSVILRKVDTTKASAIAIEHAEGTDVLLDDKGHEVLASYAHVELEERLGADFEWFAIAEIDTCEAFGPARRLGYMVLGLGALVAVLATAIGVLVARGIALPIMHGTTTLAESITEISATASQLAANASETTTSITEITTTVEEVRQTSQVASDKAEVMAEGSSEVSRITDVGAQATQDAVSGMTRIKEEMAYVAESIVKLSEQTQSIGEIIEAVDDLSDQSNLLSVNAAIEAAKAGEYGKGFSVVAQEVKNLADQSKQSTEQVRKILNDIQKATSAAVMATERVSKAVEDGVHLASQAGDSIGALSDRVSSASQSAVQIAASSQQQVAGMGQLVEAMDSIKEATTQNLDGARQLEAATGTLHDLSARLKTLAGLS